VIKEVVRLATAYMQGLAAKERELAALRARVPELEQGGGSRQALTEEWKR
jgi:hypothetical protein